MTLLLIGLLIWSAVHLLPSISSATKARLVAQFGANGYKGIFSLMILLSLVLIVLGWRSSTPSVLYVLPAFVWPLGMLLVFIAFLLLSAASMPTRVRQFIRHPQLTGVAVWAAAHLLVNGDSRSVILFGGLGLWAILEIILINRREGAWQRSEVPSWGAEVKYIVVSLAVYMVALMLHPYFAGVPIT